MADLGPAAARAEAEARVQRALDLMQEAQGLLGRAASELSGIAGGAGAWKLVGKLYDLVHTGWYRVEHFRQHGRYTLDGIALAKRSAPGAPRGPGGTP